MAPRAPVRGSQSRREWRARQSDFDKAVLDWLLDGRANVCAGVARCLSEEPIRKLIAEKAGRPWGIATAPDSIVQTLTKQLTGLLRRILRAVQDDGGQGEGSRMYGDPTVVRRDGPIVRPLSWEHKPTESWGEMIRTMLRMVAKPLVSCRDLLGEADMSFSILDRDPDPRTYISQVEYCGRLPAPLIGDFIAPRIVIDLAV